MRGKDMKYRLFLLLSLFVWQACDVKDKGNYDYTPLNGVTITFANEEANQTLEKGIDTLRIHPTVKGDIYGENEENYEYKWFFCSGKEHEHTVVGTSKDLEWPVSFHPGSYSLYFQVIDKSTGLEWITSTGVTVFSELTQGWLVLGELPDKEVRMDMVVSKPRQGKGDTLVFIENIFDNSELHLKGARGLIFTGYRGIKVPAVQLYLMTDDRDFRLTWGNNFWPVAEFHEFSAVEEQEVSRETPRIRDMFPRQANVNYSLGNTMRSYTSRGVVTDCAIYMTTIGYDNSETYVNAMNHYGDKKFFKPYPMAFVQLGTRPTGNIYPLFYDMDGECFVKPNAVYGSNATQCQKLADKQGEPFPWNQYGRTIVYGENLRNSTMDNYCNCVALMKDKEGEDINYYVYEFRPGSKSVFGTMLYDPVKSAGFTIDKTVAVDFDKATHYTFISSGKVVLYSVGATLYAYNYAYKTVTSMDMGADICCIDADIMKGMNVFWLATYDEGSQKGELKYMGVGGTQTPILAVDDEVGFPVTMKIKDVEWKYGEDPAEEEPEVGENK